MKVNMNSMSGEEPDIKKKPKKEKPKKVSNKEPETNVENTNSETPVKEKVSLITLIKTGALFRMNKFWIGVCVVLFLVLLSVNSNMNNAKTYLTVQLRNVTSDVAGLQNAIDDAKKAKEEQEKIDSLTLSEGEEQTASNNATEQGEQVAKLQNVYKKVNVTDSQEKFDENVNALDAYFDDASKEARVGWYLYQDTIPGTWEFASKAPFSGNTSKVLWLCWGDKDDMLLAYCIGTYHADIKLFSDVEYKLTKYVEAKLGTDDTGSEGEPDNIVSVIDSLKALGKNSTDAKGSEKKASAQTVKENNEISSARDTYKEQVKNGDVEGEEYDSRYNPGIEKPEYEVEEGDGNNESNE